jgi:hypothetical protein
MTGEPPWARMKKRELSNPRVTCGSCRRFDGHTWCHHWNFHTEAESPICDHYRARPPEPSAGDVAPLDEHGR